jgi:hypothetical protein
MYPLVGCWSRELLHIESVDSRAAMLSQQSNILSSSSTHAIVPEPGDSP